MVMGEVLTGVQAGGDERAVVEEEEEMEFEGMDPARRARIEARRAAAGDVCVMSYPFGGWVDGWLTEGVCLGIRGAAGAVLSGEGVGGSD